MPALVGTNLTNFVARLEACEKAQLSDWERGFIKGMRERFESREDAQDMGILEWNPTVKQWNQLAVMAIEVGCFK